MVRSRHTPMRTRLSRSPAGNWCPPQPQATRGIAGQAHYDIARRKVFNGMIDKRPRADVCCVGPADVVRTRPIADEGLRVDPIRRTADAQPGPDIGAVEPRGIRSRDTARRQSMTGIAGLTLGTDMGSCPRIHPGQRPSGPQTHEAFPHSGERHAPGASHQMANSPSSGRRRVDCCPRVGG
jgi:hypothetical protein